MAIFHHCDSSRVLSPGSRRLSPAATLLVFWLAGLSSAWSDQPPSPRREDDKANRTESTETPLRYSRIYMPREKINEVDGRYLPIRYDRFQSLVAAAQARHADPFRAAVRLDRAVYTASFQDGELIDGRATLTVVHGAGGPAAVSLDGCNLAIASATWKDGDAEGALLGTAPDGQLIAVARRSGDLELDWSLRGRRTALSSFRFQLELPSCPRNEIELVLPTDLRLVTDRGLTSRTVESQGRVRWTIVAGGARRIDLRVEPGNADGVHRPVVLYQQHDHYEFSPHGLDAAAELRLNVLNTPLAELDIELAAGVQFISARVDGTAVAWTSLPVDGGHAPRVMLQFDPPLPAATHTLRIEFTAPLPSHLPRLLPTARPRGLVWQSGAAHITIHHPLQLTELRLQDSQQSDVTTAAHPSPDRELRINYYRPEAKIEIGVEPEMSRVHARVGSTVSIGGPTTTAQVIAQWTAVAGERFVIGGQVHNPWSIDSVEVIPEGTLEDWSVSSGDGGRKQLELRLTQPLNVQHPIRVLMNASRRRVGQGRQLSRQDLQVVDFQDLLFEEAIFAVRTRGSRQLRVLGDETMVPLDVRALTPDVGSLLDLKRGDYLFRAQDAAPTLRLAHVRGTPDWKVNIEVEASVRSNQMDEVYLVDCQSEGSTLEQVVLQIAPARTETIRWTLAGQPDQELTSRRLEREEIEAFGWSADREAWEVLLPETQTETVKLRGSRQSTIFAAGESIAEVPVASAPQATQQRCKVTVLALREMPPDYRVQTGLPPLPTPLTDPSRYSAVLGSYLLPPGRIPLDAIQITRKPRAKSADAWIWDADTTTRASQSGTMLHDTVWSLENHGRAELRLQFPPAAIMRKMELNGRPLPIPRLNDTFIATIPLPAGQRYVTIRTEHSSSRLPLRKLDSLRYVAPRPNVPHMNQRWRVALPPQFSALGDWGRGDWGQPATSSWSRRLFGPLARTLPSDGDLPAARRDGAPRQPRRDGTQFTQPAGPSRIWHVPLSEGEGRLSIYNARAAEIAGWSSFLIILAVISGCRRRLTVRWLLGLAGTAAVACLLVPAPSLPLARSLFWGVMVGLLLRALPSRRPTATGRHGEEWGLRRPASQLVIILSILMAVPFSGHEQAAGETGPNDATFTSTFRVLFPVDDEGQSTSDYVFVPVRMYEQLVKLGNAAQPPTELWIVRSAVYRGKLRPGGEGEPLDIDRIDASFRLTTFRPGLMVTLPFHSEMTGQIIESVRLNGQPLEWQWSEGQQAIRFRADLAGDHDLQCSFRLRRGSFGARYGFDLRISKVASSRLELFVADLQAQPSCLTSLGRVESLNENRQFVAHLGPTSVASVRWDGRLNSLASPASIEQASWVRIHPGAVTYEARFRPTSSSEAPLRRLRLVSDARLHPLPLPPSMGTLEELEKGDARRTWLLSREKDSSERELAVRFIVSGTTGIGNVRIPMVEVVGRQLSRSWTAVSVDDELSFERRLSRDFPDVPLNDFARFWGPAADLPSFAFSRPNPSLPWSLKTYPRRSISLSDTRLDVEYAPEQTRVEFQAEIAPLEGLTCRHTLTVPEQLRIQSLVIQSRSQQHALRWSQRDDGIVNIFLDEPLSGPHRIQLAGALPPVTFRKQPLPVVALKGSTLASVEVHIRRQSSLRVEVLDHPHLQPLTPSPLPDPAGARCWPVVTLVGDGTHPVQAAVRISENSPEVLGKMMTALRHDHELWFADVDYRVEFEEGVPDAFYFQMAPGWGDALEIEPAVRWSVHDLPDGRKRLIVWPDLDDDATDYQLRISGSFSGGQSISAPVLIPLGNLTIQQWLALPKSIQSKGIEWNLQRLQAAGMPLEFAGNSNRTSGQTYRVVRADARAELRGIQTRASAPRVLLKDVELFVTRTNVSGSISFDLDPAGSSTTLLTLPDGYRLVAVQVDDQPAELKKLRHQRYRLPLGPRHLTQRVKVLFIGDLALLQAAGHLQIATPELESSSVDSEVWTVVAASGWRARTDRKNWHLLRQDELDARRLQAARKALQIQLENLSDYSAAELESWFYRWLQRMTNAYPRLHNSPLQAELSAAARRLGVEWRPDAAARQPGQSAASAVGARPASMAATVVAVQQFAIGPDRTPLTLVQPKSRSMWWASRLGPCLLLGLLTIAARRVIASPTARGLLLRWCHLILAAVGLAWMAWLRWPWMGVFFMGLSLWLAFTAGNWVTSPGRPLISGEDSTKIRDAVGQQE